MPGENDWDDFREKEAHVHYRSIFKKEGEHPSTELVAIIAELRGVEQDDFDPLYS